ncbi:hypothetical protein TcWFU_003518 [Taenia crassiceps]|uniref:Uncharacterized protein n=1 Tax=Taenia crassiceps TaxID=6207 RepID=A0ABR4Q0H0_9CEST
MWVQQAATKTVLFSPPYIYVSLSFIRVKLGSYVKSPSQFAPLRSDSVRAFLVVGVLQAFSVVHPLTLGIVTAFPRMVERTYEVYLR